jgi:hypothetical protein
MAVIMFVETEGSPTRHEAFTLDVSPFGARVQTGISLTPGQVVEVVSSDGAVPVEGRVVWVGKPASDVEGQAGLEFLDPLNIPA